MLPVRQSGDSSEMKGNQAIITFARSAPSWRPPVSYSSRRMAAGRACACAHGATAMTNVNFRSPLISVEPPATCWVFRSSTSPKRPVGLQRLRPDQANRAYEIVSTKIPEGTLKWFP